VDPRQGIPTATHDSENGASEPENGATELEPVEQGSDSLEDVDHDSDSPDNADHSSESLEDDHEGAPAPLEHATPDVELAEEQLAYGRPAEPEPDEGDDEDEFEREVEESLAGRGGRRGGRRGGGYDDESGAGASGSGELVAPGAAVPERRPSVFARLVAFLQGSWRELQRVQWPDRRQVFQATGVVIGFVIVAAVFLGVADWAAGKIVTFVLK
jgi:preprotein translocase subunit SecE